MDYHDVQFDDGVESHVTVLTFTIHNIVMMWDFRIIGNIYIYHDGVDFHTINDITTRSMCSFHTVKSDQYWTYL